jgi:hypothetical protein
MGWLGRPESYSMMFGWGFVVDGFIPWTLKTMFKVGTIAVEGNLSRAAEIFRHSLTGDAAIHIESDRNVPLTAMGILEGGLWPRNAQKTQKSRTNQSQKLFPRTGAKMTDPDFRPETLRPSTSRLSRLLGHKKGDADSHHRRCGGHRGDGPHAAAGDGVLKTKGEGDNPG